MTEEFPFDALPGEPTQVNPTPNGPATPEPAPGLSSLIPVTRQRKPRTDKGQPRKQRGERKVKPVHAISESEVVRIPPEWKPVAPDGKTRADVVLEAITLMGQLSVEDAKYVAGLFV